MMLYEHHEVEEFMYSVHESLVIIKYVTTH
jgi:hypothetical protein